jgi:YidC/Oxa1 family membrane protein insertase
MTDNKNFIIAIILSSLIIFGWQYFYAAPQLEEQRQTQEQAQQQQSEAPAQPKATQQPGVVPQRSSRTSKSPRPLRAWQSRRPLFRARSTCRERSSTTCI